MHGLISPKAILFQPATISSQGASRAGGCILSTMFSNLWNAPLPLRCLVPSGICVYFQPSCHLVATCSANQLCWKRTSLTSCLIHNFVGYTSSVLWEIAKLSKVSPYSTSPHCTLFYRPLCFPTIIYFLFNLSSCRSYSSPLLILIPFFCIISRSMPLFWERMTRLCVVLKMQS